MDNLTQEIARFSCDWKYDEIVEHIPDLLAQHIIDSIGCALAAKNTLPANIGKEISFGQTPGKFAGKTLFNAQTMPLDMAAFINSCMIRNYDFNDRFPGGHPSDGLGAHLALAGSTKITGRELILSALITYETFIRITEASKLRERGWDQGFAVGISAVAGLSRLLGLSFEQTANAISITGSATVPLRVSRSGALTAWKNVATPFAARNATFAAMLAAEGMPGPDSIFEGRAGLFDNITGPFIIDPLPHQGGKIRFEEVQIKYWPLEASGQPVVWAALELRDKLGFSSIEEIEVIEIFCDSQGKHEIAGGPEKWNPQTRETADHSMPYIFARTFADGPPSIASFSEAKVLDPTLRPLMNKIVVTIDEDIEAMTRENLAVRVVTRMKNGTILEAKSRNPPGHPKNPMTSEEIATKFSKQAEPIIGSNRAQEITHAWAELKSAPDVRPLVSMLNI